MGGRLLLLVVLLLLAEQGGASTCNGTGTWGEWKSWELCSLKSSRTYERVRYRECDPLPAGCTAIYPFACRGNYSETTSCTAEEVSSSTSTSTTRSTTTRSTTTRSTTKLPTTTTTLSTTITANLPKSNNLATCSWATWGEWSTCTDTCGMCGVQQRFRACSSTSCTCSGSGLENVGCGNSVCLYPRSSCCTGYSATSNGTAFICEQSK